MKKVAVAMLAIIVLGISCKAPASRQAGNAEKLELFHIQKQVK